MSKNPTQGLSSPAATHDDVIATAPSSASPWMSVIKVTASDWSIAAGDLACLLERNLVQRTGRALGLDMKGRVVLGLTV